MLILRSSLPARPPCSAACSAPPCARRERREDAPEPGRRRRRRGRRGRRGQRRARADHRRPRRRDRGHLRPHVGAAPDQGEPRGDAPTGCGLESMATLPLGPNRSLHLVRAGGEVVLVGVGEHGVTPDPHLLARPRRRARAARRPRRRAPPAIPSRPPATAGRCAAASTTCAAGRCAGEGRRLQRGRDPAADRRPLAHPGRRLHAHGLHPHPHRPRLHPHRPRHAHGAAEPGARGHRAVPDALRDGADLQPDQADAIDPLRAEKISQGTAFKRAEKPMREFMFDQTRTKDLALFARMAKLERPRRGPTSRPTSSSRPS